MPIKATYPGVYIEEIPSGVRTISGVSTSVTAFVGSAKRGPINRAVRVLNYGDYERRFGGLHSSSELSYGVRQFFANGGNVAWIVRIAKDATKAERELRDSSDRKVLKIVALDEGLEGNRIEVRVDHKTRYPTSTFNLTLNYVSEDNPADNRTETYSNLSMNSHDSHYVEAKVNSDSELVEAIRIADPTTVSGKGISVGQPLVDEQGSLLDVNELIDDGHNQIQISVNGLPPVKVELPTTGFPGATKEERLDALCEILQQVVSTSVGPGLEPAIEDFECQRDAFSIKMMSGQGGERSSVRVMPGERNDASGVMKMGTLNGGRETDGAAEMRPVGIPDPGNLNGEPIAAFANKPDASNHRLKISLDGLGPDTLSLGTVAATGSLQEKVKEIASRLQDVVRNLKPLKKAYAEFTAKIELADAGGGNMRPLLVLKSGTRGKGSSVKIEKASSEDIAEELKLLDGTPRSGQNTNLENGNESPYTEEDEPALFLASKTNRKGIYALDEVDLFNLLCLPGVSNPAILADAAAYCKNRRAFLIVDPPKAKDKPSEMEHLINGPELPKTNFGAIFYPWIKISDPLNAGRLRSVAPSGTMAGSFARTDSNRGVWKAPAGTETSLIGVVGLDYRLTDEENGLLNPLGVNCLRIFPAIGPVAWGARTLRGDDDLTDEYKYIPVRRLALYIEESLFRGTQWVVFEPNDEPLWAQIRLNIGAFMHILFRQGAFQGQKPREAYLVKCDKETTTQNDINNGIVNILVGFAPLKPAEFVILKIQQLAGQIQA